MNRVTKTCIRVLAVLVLMAIAKGAYADEFSFSFSSGTNSASGTLTTAPESGGSFLVTGMTGMIDLSGTSFAMTLLSPGTYGNDNLGFPTAPFLDGSGVGFSANGADWDIYYDSSTGHYLLCNSTVDSTCAPGDGSKVNFGSLTPVVSGPEPGSVGLLAVGLIGLAEIMRRRRVAASRAVC